MVHEPLMELVSFLPGLISKEMISIPQELDTWGDVSHTYESTSKQWPVCV